MEYWFGPLEVTHGRMPGLWQRFSDSSDIWMPAVGTAAKTFGDEKIGVGRSFKTSPENIIQFHPKYFSHRILTFLLAHGACFDGSLCWAQLPPALLTWQVVVGNADKKKYPHEWVFFELLKRKFPREFPLFCGEKRPDLDSLKTEAATWGL